MHKFIKLFSESIVDFYKNPILIVPGALLLLANYLFTYSNSYFSNLKGFYMYYLIVLPILLYVLICSLFINFLIYSEKEISKNGKFKLLKNIKDSTKYWWRGSVILLITSIIVLINFYFSIYSARFMGHIFNMPVNIAGILFLLIYIVFLLGITIFFTFPNFTLIINNGSLKESIKKGIKIVSKNYFYVVIIGLIFFIINQVISLIFKNAFISSLIESLIVIPYLFILLSKFVINLG